MAQERIISFAAVCDGAGTDLKPVLDPPANITIRDHVGGERDGERDIFCRLLKDGACLAAEGTPCYQLFPGTAQLKPARDTITSISTGIVLTEPEHAETDLALTATTEPKGSAEALQIEPRFTYRVEGKDHIIDVRGGFTIKTRSEQRAKSLQVALAADSEQNIARAEDIRPDLEHNTQARLVYMNELRNALRRHRISMIPVTEEESRKIKGYYTEIPESAAPADAGKPDGPPPALGAPQPDEPPSAPGKTNPPAAKDNGESHELDLSIEGIDEIEKASVLGFAIARRKNAVLTIKGSRIDLRVPNDISDIAHGAMAVYKHEMTSGRIPRDRTAVPVSRKVLQLMEEIGIFADDPSNLQALEKSTGNPRHEMMKFVIKLDRTITERLGGLIPHAGLDLLCDYPRNFIRTNPTNTRFWTLSPDVAALVPDQPLPVPPYSDEGRDSGNGFRGRRLSRQLEAVDNIPHIDPTKLLERDLEGIDEAVWLALYKVRTSIGDLDELAREAASNLNRTLRHKDLNAMKAQVSTSRRKIIGLLLALDELSKTRKVTPADIPTNLGFMWNYRGNLHPDLERASFKDMADLGAGKLSFEDFQRALREQESLDKQNLPDV